MDDSALKAAIQRLLDHGEAAQDSKMMQMAAAKKAPPPVAPCAECSAMPEGEKCEKCALEGGGDDESELAGLLEQGASEV